MSKHIITQAYNQGDWFNKDVALISVTDKFKKKLKVIRDYIYSAPDELTDYVEVREYNFGFAGFYDSDLIEDLDDDEVNIDVNTVDAWAVYDSGLDTGRVDTVEIENISNLDCIEGEVNRYYTHCVVDSSGVYFVANNKYGDEEEMSTYPIPFETILNF